MGHLLPIQPEKSLRWRFMLSFAAVLLALAVVSAFLGNDRGDVFAIAVISIVWLRLIVAGFLLARLFKLEAPPKQPSLNK